MQYGLHTHTLHETLSIRICLEQQTITFHCDIDLMKVLSIITNFPGIENSTPFVSLYTVIATATVYTQMLRCESPFGRHWVVRRSTAELVSRASLRESGLYC